MFMGDKTSESSHQKDTKHGHVYFKYKVDYILINTFNTECRKTTVCVLRRQFIKESEKR